MRTESAQLSKAVMEVPLGALSVNSGYCVDCMSVFGKTKYVLKHVRMGTKVVLTAVTYYTIFVLKAYFLNATMTSQMNAYKKLITVTITATGMYIVKLNA